MGTSLELLRLRNHYCPAPYYPCLTRNLRRLVQDGVLDVAFVLEEPIRSESLAVRSLLREEMALVTGPKHRLSPSRHISAPDLSNELILLTELGCSYRNQFEHALIAAGVYPAQTLEFSSIEAIKQCVMAGIGIAVLPEMAVSREIREGRISKLDWTATTWDVVTQMVWQKSLAHCLVRFYGNRGGCNWAGTEPFTQGFKNGDFFE